MDVTNNSDTSNTSSTEACDKTTCCKSARCPVCAILFAALLVGFLVMMFFWKGRGHNEVIGPPALKANSQELKATVISPYVGATIAPGKNVLWCSTFQLAWNEGCRAAGGDIRLKEEPPMAVALNNKLGDQKDVDAASCLVMSGLLQHGIVGKLRRELEWKFQDQPNSDLINTIERKLPRQGWLAYAYLSRSLPFEHEFKRLSEPLAFGEAKVASFGLRKATFKDLKSAEQVTILDYKNDNDFILALKPKDKSERIILAKIAPAETLQKTIETVRSRIASSKLKEWEHSLKMDESVVVPVLNFELLQTYSELVGKQIATAGPFKDMPIVLAMQNIRFRLDENGAVLKSKAALETTSASSKDHKKPRQLIFDKPFLILLERKDAAQPYFALWVDNAELLVPFK